MSRTMELRIVPVIQFVTILTAAKLGAVNCVPMKYEIGYRNSVDLDAEQTEARYDQGLLSDIMNDERPSEAQKAESCVADNFKYDHGQKIQRYDPCEICLCIDGEIFCWWKQCDVPAKPVLSDSPIGARSDVQLVTLKPSPALRAVASSSTTTTPVNPSRSPTTSSDVANNAPTSSPQPTSAASSSYPDRPEVPNPSVRIVHPQPPPENIPQNILSFPQSPPIMMMYRPGVASGGKNNSTPASAAADTERSKHGGPLKKVKPLHLAANGASGKKPYRKSKSKGYVINYGRIEGGLEEAGGQTRVLAVTERMPPSHGMRILNDGGRGFLPGGFAAEHDGGNGSDAADDDDGDDGDDDGDDDDDADGEENNESEEVERKQANAKAVANSGEGFGGYGYGMIKEPEDDKQQHYIITSSGHVEMFDDNSMEATENAFGMNRLPSAHQPFGSSTTLPPMALVLGGTLDDSPNQAATSSSVRREHDDVGEPVSDGNRSQGAPLIVMTTNVTQHSNYTARFAPDAGGGAPPASYTPLTPPLSSAQQSAAGRSVIDVLNSTTLDGGDYLDDNQTDLIYPAVPVLSSSGSHSSYTSSRRAGGVRDDGGGQHAKGLTTATTAITAETSSTPEQHCVVMGVSYKVGAVLKQETGNCLHCVCVQGPESDPVPRVTCTPLNCPPLILPDILDGAGF